MQLMLTETELTGQKNQTMLEREARVLEMLREEGYLD